MMGMLVAGNGDGVFGSGGISDAGMSFNRFTGGPFSLLP
ncbi:hypothetical protein L829_1908 [Mycobacteroides abscessus MAB_030201_1075]|uniref:Uncharacterized protein n=1 Tax=Mycobacteroides abscessus MAB_030201_1075 TaxID=1335410 RepID=A0A829PHM1_9MYCO|nr:hypothetical protein L829_1908 [Mycobacteroides abscessus MAB_030201_1075]